MSRTPLFLNFAGDSSRNRQMSWLLASSSRRKERRWPLVLRFWKGSVHSEVIWPVAILSAISAIVVYLNQHISSDYSSQSRHWNGSFGASHAAPLSRGMPKTVSNVVHSTKVQQDTVLRL
ncbi:hypothetical protein BHYA_0077g00490 [Botrytis hyacinthi]|uniref:Uncharacterized protein n=1 Tax=Botrytis hyacinthi TaxID=278943 RepID=A0A4Z1GPR5_9HELO|nr:hypothetical protein BHYA_0077g00490 [Botrytis hyacinthi]